MTDDLSPRDPETLLALAYAPAGRRAALATLFALDQRFADVVAAAREPGIGLIKLAWWRDALIHLDRAPPPAHPLLQAVARDLLPAGLTGAALAELEEGWNRLLRSEAPDKAALTAHARLRGGALFALAAVVLGRSGWTRSAAGTLWALIDRARATPDADARAAALCEARRVADALPGGRWPVRLRSLGVLVALAARDARAGRVSSLGSPGRLLRALKVGLTGS